MLVKKLGMLFVLLLVLVTLAVPAVRVGACSGDDCGCGVAFEECRLNCFGNLSCISVCRKENIKCSKACCGC
jgi:hypothetical protein